MTQRFPHVEARFPDRRRAISERAAGDPEFAEICADYETCVHLAGSPTPGDIAEPNPRIAAEYHATAIELADEIDQALQAMMVGASS